MRDDLCPVCGEEMPERKPRGRPAEVCGRTCAVRARQRRAKAAKLLDLALLHDHLAAETAAGRLSGRGNVMSLEVRSARLRAMAADALLGLPN